MYENMISQILLNIFGEYPSVNKTIVKNFNSNKLNINFEDQLKELDQWLNKKLIVPETESSPKQDEPSTTGVLITENGRIGPTRVIFDIEHDPLAQVNISEDKLTIQSQSAFATVKANVAVFKGKWMYEVQLRSKGVMQIGWCSAKCKFTSDTGVGDTKYSYGLDGSKQRIWHVYTQKYGPYWRSGDIFGVCLDMDGRKIEYYRNGDCLGEAFNNVEQGPGLALYPAVSLAFNDSLTANFGGSPFRHPVKGYKPLQKYPDAVIKQSDYLLQYLANLARLVSRLQPNGKTAVIQDSKTQIVGGPSEETIYVLLSSVLVERISTLLHNSYVVEDKVFSFIRSMCVIRSEADKDTVIHPGQINSTLGTFLTLLWDHLDHEEMSRFIKRFITYLASIYKETPTDLEYERQRMVIVILTCICNHPKTRKHLLEFVFFKKNCLPLFLYIKPPDESVLEQLLPDDNVWTEGIGGPEELYFGACEKLKQCTSVLYSLQKNLMQTMLINDDSHENDLDDLLTSRRIFMKKYRSYVFENNLEHRIFLHQGLYTTPTQPAVGLSFLCLLLDVIKSLWSTECSDKPQLINLKYFFDGTLRYTNIDRIGGVLSHLRKVHRNDMIARLGENHSEIIQLNPTTQNDRNDLSDIYSAMFLMSNAGTSSRGNIISFIPFLNANQSVDLSPVSPGSIESYQSLCELLDCAVIYYYAVAHKYVVMIADLRDNIALLSDILHETKDCCDDVIKNLEDLKFSPNSSVTTAHDEVLKEMHERFGQRKSIFAKRSMELARKQAWYRSVALGKQRRDLLCWLLNSAFETLQAGSDEGTMFVFIPEIYINALPILLDAVLDFSFHDTRTQYDLSDSEPLIKLAAEFLGNHSADTRVFQASCRDSLLQALGTLICHEAGIRALESATSSSQLSLVRSLLKPYENRAWGQSNWLLLRFWLGEGFGYRESRPPCIWQGGNKTSTLGLHRSRGKHGSNTGLLHHIAPACPSKHFQLLISRLLINDEPFSTVFVNSVLSQLNWAFSEFILLLQEIQQLSERQETNVVIESRQLKICSMCFDLTVSLMRALEMIITIAPQIFLESSRPNSDLLLGRVCQLVSQVLSRVTIPPGCFQHVLDLCLPDLSTITHFSIITASIGILLALMKDELASSENVTKVPRVSKFLLTDPSFQVATLEYVLGEVRTPLSRPSDVPRGNFDPKMKGIVNDSEERLALVRPSARAREIIPDPPIIQFSLNDYPTHVTIAELEKVRKMINLLLFRQTLLSDVMLPSEDSLCPICYAKCISSTFEPCHHQSCNDCIMQHLMNSKVCFYCKTLITSVKNSDDAVIYEYSGLPAKPSESEDLD